MKRVVKRSSAVQLTVILNNQRSVSVPQEYHIHKISRLQLIILKDKNLHTSPKKVASRSEVI